MEGTLIFLAWIAISVILSAKKNAKRRQDLFENKQGSTGQVGYEKTSTQSKTRPKRTLEELSKKQEEFIAPEMPAADFHVERVEHDTDVYYEPTKVSYEEDQELTNLNQINQQKTKKPNKKKADKSLAKTSSEKRSINKEKKINRSNAPKIDLKQAYLWKEILDKPIALREEEFW